MGEPVTAEASDRALKALKLWAVSGAFTASKEAHMGPRGLKRLTDAEMNISEEELLRRESLLPDPPE